MCVAAKSALRRKKLHERTLEQTSAQIQQVEQQIYSIEAANINQETLNAMKNAGAAMKQIHGGLTIDKVDATMDELREQHALGEEIAAAITNAPIGEPLDEADLEDELEGMEQEAMDERMLKTGTLPVSGEVSRLPAVATGPGESDRYAWLGLCTNGTQYEVNHRRKRKTRRKSCESYRPRWLCKGSRGHGLALAVLNVEVVAAGGQCLLRDF